MPGMMEEISANQILFFLESSLPGNILLFYSLVAWVMPYCNLLRLQGILQRNLENETYDLKPCTASFSHGERDMSLRAFSVFL